MPNFRILNRRLHRWGAVAVALPFLLIIGSGITLQVKKQVAWVQPPEQRGTGVAGAISLERILEAARSEPRAGIASWDDIDRIDVRPGKNLIKVIGHSRWELQLDAATGRVMQVAYRRSDLLESIHDGSFFHDAAKLWVFLPVGLIVFGLWITGIYLYLLPYRARAARRRGTSLSRAA
jgi:hypothetical protein